MTLYHTTFDNRLQSFAAEVPGTGGRTETFWQNVGAVDAYGVEFTGGWRPKRWDNLVLTTNVTYNVAEFEDDFPGFQIAGNRVPDNGEWIVQSAVTYEPTGWAVLGLSAKYLSDRYTNFGNTEMVGGYTTYAAYLDLGGDKFARGVLKHFKMRLNVDNLTDKDYFGTINVTTGAAASFRPLPARTYQLTLSASW
jgi:iron complex outermembrane receptor protein